AEDTNARTRLERLLVARIEREEAQHQRCVTVLVANQADELPPWPILDLGAPDRPLGLHRFADVNVAKRHDARVILVAKRQMQDQVLVAQDADACELVGERVARLPCLAVSRLDRRPARYGYGRLPCEQSRPCQRITRARPAPPRPRSSRRAAAPRPDTSHAPDRVRRS